jgi:hypothetical protein
MTIKRKNKKRVYNVGKDVNTKETEFTIFISPDECVHIKAKSYREAKKIARAQYSFMFNRERRSKK